LPLKIIKHKDQANEGKIDSRMRMSNFFCKKEKPKCRKKEKQQNKIEGNLSLRRRRIETLNARIKSPPDWKDKNPDKISSIFRF
jgi:hypothetical protein